MLIHRARIFKKRETAVLRYLYIAARGKRVFLLFHLLYTALVFRSCWIYACLRELGHRSEFFSFVRGRR